MDPHMIIDHFEVKAPVAGTEPVERLAIPLDLAEAIILQMGQIVLVHLELVEEFKLLQGIEKGDFGRADLVEDDLKHARCYTAADRMKRENGRGSASLNLSSGI